LARLQQGVAPFAGRLVPLPDGSILILLESTASAAEQAEMAAYCALEVRALLPGVPIALCLGHSEQAADRLDAEVVERAAAMLAHCPRAALAEGAASPATAPILIDESLRALLTSHFACSRVAGLNVLHDKRAAQNLSSPERLAPFAGRERELAQLHIVLGNCLDESRADAVLILGEAGMGKSRLCHEFLAQVRAQHPELTIWIGRADPSSAGSPFGLIAQTLRRAAGIADDDSPPLQRAKLRERLGLLPPDDRARVYEFIGELLGLPGDDRESPPLAAARRDPLLMGDQLRRAFCDLLAAECRAQPLLLVLEDLQWGDLPTVHLIDAALRELPELPLLVLALSRPQIHEQFPRLWEGRSVQQMPLGQLGQKAGERIVRGLLGDDVTPAQVQALVERGAGNAFFLEELARAAAEGHLDQVPESVLAIVQARIMRLDAPARSVLRAASVYGQAFWPGGVACLLGLPAGPDGAATVSGLLAQLVARDLISQRRESRFRKEPEYCFRHALVRQAAYAMLTESDRRLGHRLAADFLLRAGEQDALVLADHLDLGGEADRAVTHYRRVVRDAVEGNDFAAALAYAERAIAGGAQGEALGELLALQAEARLWRSEFEQAQERALAALACLPTRHPAYYRAIESLAITAGRRLDNQQLASLTDRLLELAEAGERSDAYVVAAVRLGAQTYIAGQYELARRLLSRIEELTSADAAERPPAIQAQIYVMRGNRAAYEWRIDTCAELYERSAELFDRAGDLRSGASQRLDAAMTCFDFGAFGRSVRLLQQTIAIAERLGLVRLLAMSRHGLASTLWRLERLDEALALAERARHELSRQGDARGVGTCLINLARIHLSRGALDAAEGCAEQARQVLAGTPRFQARALVQLARVQLGYGRNDQALALAQQAMEALSRLGRLGADEAALRLCHAQALLAVGDTAAASAAAQLGRERLQMQAAFIATESARQSFLTGLAENVQLLDLAAQLAPPAAAPGL
jgi:predicted ATPase